MALLDGMELLPSAPLVQSHLEKLIDSSARSVCLHAALIYMYFVRCMCHVHFKTVTTAVAIGRRRQIITRGQQGV